MQIRTSEILVYTTPSGLSPYWQWYTRIKDEKVKINIFHRIGRLRAGNFGDFKQLSTDLYELRIYYGLSVKHPLQLDKTLDILSGLKECLHTNPPEETPSMAHEKSGDSEEHDENYAG